MKILLKNSDSYITSKDGWCNNSKNKPLSNELVRVLSPQSQFEDSIVENIYYKCNESIHQTSENTLPVWECQIGIVETHIADQHFFASRSIFFSLDKDNNQLYMDSIRCLN